MIQKLKLSLLGVPQIYLDEEILIDQLAVREQALLFYLAVDGQVRNRSTVAALLWDAVSDTQALKNLRDVLPNLRRRLGSHLLITHQSVGFNRQVGNWLDVEEFQHTWQARMPSNIATLRSALELYRGEFLEDFYVRQAPGFEEWLLLQRQQMHTLAVEGWQTLANHYIEQGEKGAGLMAVRRLLGLEPWYETAHQQLMRLLMRSGQRSAALAQYEICQRALADGLDVRPSAETTALYEAILHGTLAVDPEPASAVRNPEPLAKPDSMPTNPTKARRVNWDALPAINKLYGREQEVAQVERWLLHEQCHLITIFGIGGQGKTTLATKIVRSLAEATTPTFDVILWQSLVNAPPLAEVLQSWLPILSNQQITTLPATRQQQFALLLDYLQQQRCLLVLDNLESISMEGDDDGRASAYRPGYENYAELMRCFGEAGHQSCLLITSRERPVALARMEELKVTVRSLQLEGLSKAAGQAMLYAYGLTEPVEAVHTLIQNYSGNPLALTLMGETIWDLFEGDIAAFAREDSLIFGDIRHVLDQQFARLNLLEREILFWLAIEREPVSLTTLRHNLVQPEAQRAILQSLRSLLRRALLEKQDEFYSLQNVVMEYLTNLLVEKIAREICIAPWLAHDAPLVTPAALPYASNTHIFELSRAFSESSLNCFALIKAKTKVYVRESQTRLLLKPLADQVVTKLGKPAVEKRCRALLTMLRTTAPLLPGYAAANLLHLLLHLETDLHDYDFSQLAFWQANLQGVRLPPVTFAQAHFKDTLFTESFSDVTSLVFFPNSEYFAAGTRAGGIFLWRLTDQSPYRALSGHTDTTFIALSADGTRLASASADGTLRLWQLTGLIGTAPPTRILAQQLIPFTAVAFSPDGRLLISGSDDGTVRLWDGITGAPGPILYTQTSAVLTLTLAPVVGCGLVLASSGGGDIYLWALEAECLLANWKGHHDLIWSLAFSPDGRLLASGSADQTVHLWQIAPRATGTINNEPPPSISLEGHTAPIYALAFSPDGNTLAISGLDENMCLWDVQTHKCQIILRMHKSWVRAVAFSPDGKTLVSGGNDHRIGLWHLTPNEYASITGQLNYTLLGHASFAYSVAFSPQGIRLASSHVDGLVRLWNIHSGELECILHGHTGAVHAVAFSPNSQQLASVGNDGFVGLWQMPNGNITHVLPGYEGALRSVAFSPDGATVVVGGNRPYAQLWHTQTGQLQHTLRDPLDQVWSAAFSPDGQTVAIGTHAQGLLLWDVASGELRGTLPAAQNAVLGLAFHPGGTLLAGGSVDKCIRLWDIRSGRLLHQLREATHWIYAVAFSPVGNLLAAATMGGSIYIWDIEQQDDHIMNVQLRHHLQGHTIAVNSIAFSPNGQQLASGATDETIRIWDLDNGDCVSILRAEGPYTGMNIINVTGLTEAQLTALRALGAVEERVYH